MVPVMAVVAHQFLVCCLLMLPHIASTAELALGPTSAAPMMRRLWRTAPSGAADRLDTIPSTSALVRALPRWDTGGLNETVLFTERITRLNPRNKEVSATLCLQANMSGWQSVSCFGCPYKHMAIKLIIIYAWLVFAGSGSVATIGIDADGKLTGPVRYAQHTGSSRCTTKPARYATCYEYSGCLTN